MLNNVAFFEIYSVIWLAHVGFMFNALPNCLIVIIVFMQSCTFIESDHILYIETEYDRNMYECIMQYSIAVIHEVVLEFLCQVLTDMHYSFQMAIALLLKSDCLPYQSDCCLPYSQLPPFMLCLLNLQKIKQKQQLAERVCPLCSLFPVTYINVSLHNVC